MYDVDIPVFSDDGELFNLNQRWVFGMQAMGHTNVKGIQMPSAGTNYSSGYIGWGAREYIYSPQYLKLNGLTSF